MLTGSLEAFLQKLHARIQFIFSFSFLVVQKQNPLHFGYLLIYVKGSTVIYIVAPFEKNIFFVIR